MSASTIARIIGVGIFIFVVILMASSGTYVIHPGYRGVEVTMGKVTPAPKKEGFGLKMPLVTRVEPVSIRQQTAEDQAECYSADLQQIHIELRVLYRIPESSVVKLYQGYDGDPFQSLVAPRIHEALKEVAALQSAEQIVKNREQIKTRALDLAKQKLAALLVIEDIVIQNIRLTKELEHAIEAKMVAEQEAARARFTQQQTEIEAQTVIIRAKRSRGHQGARRSAAIEPGVSAPANRRKMERQIAAGRAGRSGQQRSQAAAAAGRGGDHQAMSPRWRAFLVVLILVLIAGLLLLFFKPATEFVEMAARELRYLWWIILLVALAVWLIWGVGRKPKK